MDVKPIINFFKHLHITGTQIQIGTLEKVIVYGEQIFPFPATFEKLLEDFQNQDMYFLGNIVREKYQHAPHKRETHDDDIEQKRYVFFDFDIRNHFKENDLEVTDQEIKDIATDFIASAKDHPLWSKWSFIVFTGNGIHIYYVSGASYVNKKQFAMGYKYFAEQLDPLVGIPSDKKCSNLARIGRLPGSYNNKQGKHTLVEIIASQPQESFVIDQIMSYQPPKKVDKPITAQVATGIVFPEYTNGVSYDEVLAFVKKKPIREMCSDFGIEVTYKGEIVLDGDVTSARINEEGNYINRFSGKGGSGDFISILKQARAIDFKEACDLVAQQYFKKQVVFTPVNNKAIATEEMQLAALTRIEQIRQEASKMSDILGRFNVPQTKNVKTWGISNVDEKFGNVRNGEYILFLGEAGTGKCLGKGTKVMMADCSIKNVEDIFWGDQLMGPDSKPRNILGLGRGKDRMYKIIPEDLPEDYFICNEPHILSLKGPEDQILNISVKEYLANKDTLSGFDLYRETIIYKEPNGYNKVFVPDSHRTGFSIEYIGEDDYYGFELDGDHLYVLDSLIVTHNTTYCLNMMIENAKRGVKCLFLSLEMAKERIEDRYIETRAQLTQQDRERGKYSDAQMKVIEECIRDLQNPYIHMIDMVLLKDDKRNWLLMKELFNDYDIIFIDNFSKIIPRDNKEEYQLQSMISEEIANYVEGTGKIVVMLHHYGKQMGNSKSRGMEARGSQKLIDDISTHFSLQRAEDGSNATIISVKKGRYIPVGSVAVLFNHGTYEPYAFDEIAMEPVTKGKKHTESIIF